MSSSSIQQFRHEQFGTIRTTTIDGEPWFVAKDIALALGYTNPQKAVRDHVDDEDRTVNDSFTVNGTKAVLINESGTYSLILTSRLPEAKAFKRWVTHEVLPSIRKTGGYIAGQESMTPEQMVKASMQWLEARISEQEQQIELQNEMISVMRPKALFADAVSMSATSIPIGDLAKVLKRGGTNIGRNRLMRLMRNDGYLMKQRSSKNMPTQKAMNLGLLYIEEKTVVDGSGKSLISKRTMVTGKGQTYFHRLYCISPQLQLPLPQLQLPL